MLPRLVNRRSLSASVEPLEGGQDQRRVSGGPRREVSDRVKLMVGEAELEGWALNISKGGLRAILDTEGVNLEEIFALGREIKVAVGELEERPARIVWVQAEPDGAVIGVAFLDQEESRPPSVPPGALPQFVRSPMPSVVDEDSINGGNKND
jgi:hypothetical protein